MLQRRDPAVGHRPGKQAVFLVLDIELLVGVPVVVRGPAERERLRIPHRALVAKRMTQQLRVRGELDRLRAAVCDFVAQVDPVRTAVKDEDFPHREARAIRPGEGHLEHVGAVRELIFRRGAREIRLVIRLVAARLARRQARLEQELGVRRVRVEEPDGCRRVILVLRVLQDVRADEFGAREARVHVEHVGADADLARRRRLFRHRSRHDCRRVRGRRGLPGDFGQLRGQAVRRVRRRCGGGRGRRLLDDRRVVLHPGLDVEVEQEPESHPQQHADLRVHARRASGTGS